MDCLPVPRVEKLENGKFHIVRSADKAAGQVSAFMGNFGVMDKRNRAGEGETKWGRFLRKNRRVFSNLRYYPREVIWSPFARVSQYVWRKLKGYL